MKSAAQCTARCDADAQCQCVTYCATASGDCGEAGDCWKRAACVPDAFEQDAATQPYTVYLKAGVPTPAPASDGALAYLKHDSMGPAGDAAVVVFNPTGAAASVTVDLSSLAGTAALNGKPVNFPRAGMNERQAYKNGSKKAPPMPPSLRPRLPLPWLTRKKQRYIMLRPILQRSRPRRRRTQPWLRNQVTD